MLFFSCLVEMCGLLSFLAAPPKSVALDIELSPKVQYILLYSSLFFSISLSLSQLQQSFFQREDSSLSLSHCFCFFYIFQSQKQLAKRSGSSCWHSVSIFIDTRVCVCITGRREKEEMKTKKTLTKVEMGREGSAEKKRDVTCYAPPSCSIYGTKQEE